MPWSNQNVNIQAGTVDIAGTVDAVITSGTVDVGTIESITAGDISVVNNPSVFAIPNVKFIGTFSAGTTTGIDVSKFNSLIIMLTITASGFHSNQYGWMELTPSDSASGVALPPSFYFLQASTFNNNVGSFGNGAQTVFPLHGMDTLEIDFEVNDTGLSMSASIFGTTESLPEYHRTQEYGEVSHILMFDANHIMPAGGSTFPIPVSSKPVRLYVHPHSGNTGTSQAVQLTDTVTGALLMNATVPKGQNLGQEGNTNPATPYLLLPHTMSPMTLFTGTATANDLIDVFLTDDV